MANAFLPVSWGKSWPLGLEPLLQRALNFGVCVCVREGALWTGAGRDEGRGYCGFSSLANTGTPGLQAPRSRGITGGEQTLNRSA